MHINETIINAVLSTLGENGKWMTANEIIAYAAAKDCWNLKMLPGKQCHILYTGC